MHREQVLGWSDASPSFLGSWTITWSRVRVVPWAALASALFGLAIAATGWTALRILRDPHSSDKSFDEQFYQDRNDIRRNGPE